MDGNHWNKIICKLPHPHILQTWEWGEFKSRFGWVPSYKVWGSQDCPDAAALILERSVTISGLGRRFQIQYVPKGPLIKDWSDHGLVNRVLSELREFAKQRGAIFIKIDPDVPFGVGIPNSDEEKTNPLGKETTELLNTQGWIYSKSQIQFRNTVLLDLQPKLDDIMAGMKQKTRYNVRLAKRKGVTIRSGTKKDFKLLYKMYAETSLRDGFAIRDANYYHLLWKIFSCEDVESMENGLVPCCEPLIAEVEGEEVAAIVVYYFAGKAYYMHGMSRPIHRKKMPNYLLQWEAIVRSKSSGCKMYDLWGAPEFFKEDDSMWGVYRFKEGFGGEVLRTIGAYDCILKPILYKVYSEFLPKLFNVLRRKGKSQIERSLQNSEEEF